MKYGNLLFSEYIIVVMFDIIQSMSSEEIDFVSDLKMISLHLSRCGD